MELPNPKIQPRDKPPAITFAAAAFLLPNLLGFLLFTLIPVLISLVMGFTNWSLKPVVKIKFTGLDNAIDILGVHSTSAPQIWLPIVYYGAAILAVFAGAALLWSLVSHWRGSINFLLILVLLCAVAALWLLNSAMWSHYEPNDKRFWAYLYNTLYLMLGIPPSIIGALLLAMLLNGILHVRHVRESSIILALSVVTAIVSVSIFWGTGWRNLACIAGLFWLLAILGVLFDKKVFRGIFYLPAFTSGIALMILWKAMYNPQVGLLNNFLAELTRLPLEKLPLWLSSVSMAKPSLILMNIWLAIGGMNMLLYLAALGNVSPELVEAALIDGANAWQRFRHIYIPQLAPTTFFITIMSIIGGLQGGFEQARVMTNGGPAGSTTTLSYYIYTMAFEDLQLGRAATTSWILFFILFIFTAIYWKIAKQQDYGQ